MYVSYYNQTFLIVNKKNDIFHIFMQKLHFLYIFMLIANFKHFISQKSVFYEKLYK